jgi:hypothetical protein
MANDVGRRRAFEAGNLSVDIRDEFRSIISTSRLGR